MDENILIREIDSTDREAISKLVKENWGSDKIVSRGKVYNISKLSGFIAFVHGRTVGLLSYNIENDSMEIVLLESLIEGKGIGTTLINKAKSLAKDLGLKRIWLITSNDNIEALKFYQRRGFRMVAIHKNAIEEARKLKPEIPTIGYYGIPIIDEIELEMELL